MNGSILFIGVIEELTEIKLHSWSSDIEYNYNEFIEDFQKEWLKKFTSNYYLYFKLKILVCGMVCSNWNLFRMVNNLEVHIAF